MLILNFTHPLTTEQREQTATLLGVDTVNVQNINVHIDRNQALSEVARALTEAVQLSPTEWQTEPFVVNPPGLAPLALALIAEIHGRVGHFPTIINIRPIPNATPVRYEVAELVDLQRQRDQARKQR
jgi:hypothetical protein